MARRFFIEKAIEIEEEFLISGEEAKHIMVLRHNIGDKIQVNDKICEIISIDKSSVKCIARDKEEEKGVPNVKITLFQALLKSDKMEFVIQKAVELGVSTIVPFSSKNVVVKLDDKDKIKKIERWNKISLEATKQCGRSDIVKVLPIINLKEVGQVLSDFDKCILAYENETENLKDVIRKNLEAKNIAIIIGAEGGFERSEVEELLKNNNCKSVSLGDRILRAETASLNLISILMYELE